MRIQQYAMKGALTRMLNRKLSMAFEKWQYEAAAMKREAYALRGALTRMLNRKFSMAFEKWQFTAAEMANQLAITRRALLTWINKKLAMGFKKWQEFVDQINAQRAAMNRALMKLIKSTLARAFAKWVAVAERRRGANPFEKAARYFIHGSKARAFNTWRQTAKWMSLEDKRREKLEDEYANRMKDNQDALTKAYARIRELEAMGPGNNQELLDQIAMLKKKIKGLEDEIERLTKHKCDCDALRDELKKLKLDLREANAALNNSD